MKISRALLAAILLGGSSFCLADEALNLPSANASARGACPEVATERLRKLLRKNLPADERRTSELKIGRSADCFGRRRIGAESSWRSPIAQSICGTFLEGPGVRFAWSMAGSGNRVRSSGARREGSGTAWRGAVWKSGIVTRARSKRRSVARSRRPFRDSALEFTSAISRD